MPSFPIPTISIPIRELLYASMTVRDQSYKYFRFQTPDDNLVDYL